MKAARCGFLRASVLPSFRCFGGRAEAAGWGGAAAAGGELENLAEDALGMPMMNRTSIRP